MGENSKIEWTDHTFNPWVGCEKVSPACDHCYAESWAKRTGSPGLWQGERRRTTEANWSKPYKWDRKAEIDGVPRRVFCASLADVFDNAVSDEWRADLFRMIRHTPNLIWLLLTKRIGNAERMLPAYWGDGLPNVWLGATVVNQDEADRDIPKLLGTPATVRFLSCEPLLGPIDLLSATLLIPDWVIAGGESGPKARPSHPDWFRFLRDQCVQAGIPFHFKQWGNWTPARRGAESHLMNVDGRLVTRDQAIQTRKIDDYRSMDEDFIDRGHPGWARVRRVSKKLAGRTLDGETWDQYPE